MISNARRSWTLLMVAIAGGAVLSAGSALIAAPLPQSKGGKRPAVPAAKENAPPRTAAESIDRELLDDLKTDLLDGALDDAAERAGKPAGPARPAGRRPEGTDLGPGGVSEDGAGEGSAGEDLGQKQENPIVRLSEEMRQAGDKIEKDQPAAETRALHEKIVTDLDRLIHELEKKCAGGQCQKPSLSQGRPKPAGSQPKPGKASPRPGTSAARDSVTGQRADRVRPADTAAVQGLIEEVWGQLPERARQQLMQLPPEQFLPQYEALIEQYYRRLAEEAGAER